MDMTLMNRELSRDEGRRYDLYYDSLGIPSTGVGRNLRAKPLPDGWTFPLDDDQVDQLLNSDLSDTFAELDANIPWWRTLDEVRQRVIANMCFNMGWGNGTDGLSAWPHFLADVQGGYWGSATALMRTSKWANEVGARATRLATGMLTGIMGT